MEVLNIRPSTLEAHSFNGSSIELFASKEVHGKDVEAKCIASVETVQRKFCASRWKSTYVVKLSSRDFHESSMEVSWKPMASYLGNDSARLEWTFSLCFYGSDGYFHESWFIHFRESGRSVPWKLVHKWADRREAILLVIMIENFNCQAFSRLGVGGSLAFQLKVWSVSEGERVRPCLLRC